MPIEENPKTYGQVMVGESIGRWPGNIYVSEATIAQYGINEVLRMVRKEYHAAYEWRARMRDASKL